MAPYFSTFCLESFIIALILQPTVYEFSGCVHEGRTLIFADQQQVKGFYHDCFLDECYRFESGTTKCLCFIAEVVNANLSNCNTIISDVTALNTRIRYVFVSSQNC